MTQRRLRRAYAVVPALCACAILAGCGRDGEDTDRSASRDSVTTSAAATGTTVIFHMTGLLLLVPDGTSMRVLLPEMAGHVARLGIGFEPGYPPGPAGFCDDAGFPVRPTSKGICYVNLRYWKLADFGANGTPPLPAGALPPGVLNVTEHWQYRAPLPADSAKLRGQLTLLAGAPGEPCSLARWKFKPFAQAGGPHPEKNRELVNVLRWTVSGVTNPELVFLPRTSRMDAACAFHRPPSTPRSNTFGVAAFYRRLRRPYASFPGGCLISRAPLIEIRTSPRTFSCMMATADRL